MSRTMIEQIGAYRQRMGDLSAWFDELVDHYHHERYDTCIWRMRKTGEQVLLWALRSHRIPVRGDAGLRDHANVAKQNKLLPKPSYDKAIRLAQMANPAAHARDYEVAGGLQDRESTKNDADEAWPALVAVLDWFVEQHTAPPQTEAESPTGGRASYRMDPNEVHVDAELNATREAVCTLARDIFSLWHGPVHGTPRGVIATVTALPYPWRALLVEFQADGDDRALLRVRVDWPPHLAEYQRHLRVLAEHAQGVYSCRHLDWVFPDREICVSELALDPGRPWLEVVGGLVHQGEWTQLAALARDTEELLRSVVRANSRLGEGYRTVPARWVQTESASALHVDAREHPPLMRGSTLVVPRGEDGSMPGASVRPLTATELLEKLSVGSSSEWLSLAIDDARAHACGARIGARDLALFLHAEFCADWGGAERITFHSTSRFYTPEQLHELLGVEASARAEPQALRAVADRLERFHRWTIHGCLPHDLVVVGGLPAVRGFGRLEEALVGTEPASLELALWERMAPEAGLADADVRHVLARLEEEAETETATQDAPRAVEEIIRVIRKACVHGRPGTPLPRGALTVAYVASANRRQRQLLPTALGPDAPHVPTALNQAWRYWLARLRAAGLRSGVVAAPPSSEQAEHAPSDGTLRQLWEEALKNRRGRPAQPWYRWIGARDTARFDSPPTQLQAHVLEKCLAGENPFSTDRHVVLTGPTSSGKSTVADMFLVRTLALGRRRAAIYVAPTKALARAKFRDLQRLLGERVSDSELVLSTGDDTEYDWAIVHGRFRIACMVYEKANILFSRSRRLLSQLGCIVIDEMHMLADLDRGPLLEMVLTKVNAERYEQDHNALLKSAQKPQIVAISTERGDDAGMRSCLSITRPDPKRASTQTIPPQALTVTHRPTEIEHHFAIPSGVDGKVEFLSFHRFAKNVPRELSGDQVDAIEERLTYLLDKPAGRIPYSATRSLTPMEWTLDVLERLVDEVPYGSRILVFVPGKARLERLAAGWIRRLAEQGLAPFDSETVTTALTEGLHEADEHVILDLVRQAMRWHCFLHHADVPPRTRHAIEELAAATVGQNERTHVLFATETLSYGVNLAVADVVLDGIEFPSATRRRQPRHVPLTPSAYHNMVGRCGRYNPSLGKQAGRVFVIPAPEDNPITSIVEPYYLEAPQLFSQLFVPEEDGANARPGPPDDPCRGFEALDVGAFTYPFARSILDALRHVNLSHADGGVIQTKLSKVHDLLAHTLYVHQVLGPPTGEGEATEEGRRRFRCAVKRVLDICSERPLELVKLDPARDQYKITERGQAVIDTGTEITTIEPLLRFVESVSSGLDQSRLGRAIPTDLYLLCLLAMEEMYRLFLRQTPECSTRKAWTQAREQKNRRTVGAWFQEAIRAAAPGRDSKAIAKVLSAVLEEQAFQVQSAYKDKAGGAAADGLKRLFTGVIRWISGDNHRRIYEAFEDIGQERTGAPRARVSLRQLTEQLSWKTVFLARMLATAERESSGMLIGTDEERQLYRLAAQLRFGCTGEAVPFFWFANSSFNRGWAVKLMKGGITPSKLLSAHSCRSRMPNALKPHQSSLREAVAKYAHKSLSELSAEMDEHQHQESPLRDSVRAFWERLTATLSAQGSRTFHEARPTALPFPELISSIRFVEARESGLHRVEEAEVRARRPTIRGERLPEGGALWTISVTVPREDRWQLTVVGVQMASRWRCCADGQRWIPFHELLARHSNAKHLVVVMLPWVPDPSEMPDETAEALRRRADLPGYSAVLASPAGFGATLSMVARQFVEPTFLVPLFTGRAGKSRHPQKRRASTRHSGRHFDFVGVEETQLFIDELETIDVPQSIRGQMLQHFEARPMERVQQRGRRRRSGSRKRQPG